MSGPATKIEIGSDHRVVSKRFRDTLAEAGEYIDDGSGTWTLYGPGDRTTFIDDGAMTVTPGVSGQYVGDVPDTVTADLDEDAQYWIKIVLEAADGTRLVQWLECVAGYGSATPSDCEPCTACED